MFLYSLFGKCVLLRSSWSRPWCCLDKGLLSVCQRSVCHAVSAPPAHLGLGKTALQSTYGSVNNPHSHPVPLGGKRDCVTEGWEQGHGSCLAVGSEHHSPGAPRWLQLLPGTARSLMHLQSLRKYFLVSAKTRIAYLSSQFVSDIFAYFHNFLWKCHVFVSSKGEKCPLCFLFFFQCFSGTNKCFLSSSHHYKTEVKEQSASSWEKKALFPICSYSQIHTCAFIFFPISQIPVCQFLIFVSWFLNTFLWGF